MEPDSSCSRRARKTRQSRDIKDVFTAPKRKRNAFRVPKYKTAQAVVTDENQDEEFDFTGVDLTQTGTTNRKGKGKEPEIPPAAEGRSTKRRKIAHDLDFLETSLPHATQPSGSFAPQSAFAVPSSDLLKYIHHFACNYYSDRGQLFNESRTWRKGRRERKLAKLAAKAKLNSEEEEGTASEPDADLPKTVIPPRRDMYKTMDGSALLAIGMLLQEQIAQILAPKIPDDWEEGGFEESGPEDDGKDTDVQGEIIRDGRASSRGDLCHS
ncbi:hypothetical protein MSAN_00705600 [Mycena sanguinolenta]|uniref:Uncharacterized protein n=1 Tax=Mycena sanguinolenta TaxID=230812 RepID=A0A8H6Z4D6_9AGAR|nr:hypothetical protein MSAN_00705600 [Mycena sanguinolenta]